MSKKLNRAVRSKLTVTRRGFLVAAAVVAGPLILPSGVLALNGRPGASSRIVTGHIGLGSSGFSMLRLVARQAGALCEADEQHLRQTSAVVGSSVKVHRNYRRLLEQQDIDAVVIATPDHWHGMQTIHACEAGKDVFLETPPFKYLAESPGILDAAQTFGTVLDVGLDAIYGLQDWTAPTNVKRVRCWAPGNPSGGDPSAFRPTPPSLDWRLWLGPARTRPYNPDFVHGNFRWMMDFGGGRLCREGFLFFTLALMQAQRRNLGKVKIEAEGTAPESGLWDAPSNLRISFHLENPGLTIVWDQPGVDSGDSSGIEFEGAATTKLLLEQGRLVAAGSKAPNNDAPQHPAFEHWVERIHSREKPRVDLGVACAAAELCQAGNLAYLLGRTLTWDSEAGRFDGDEQANRLLAAPAFPGA